MVSQISSCDRLFAEEAGIRAEWLALARKDAAATFFHQPEWYGLFLDAPGKRILLYRFLLASGKIAIFPFLARRVNRFETECASGPAGVYGGWVSDALLDGAEASAISEHVRRETPFFIWRLNPFENWQAEKSREEGGDFTQAIRLERPWEEIERGVHETRRWEVRKSSRDGITVRAAAGDEDWDNYYSCYLDSRERWGANAGHLISLDFFRRLAQLPEGKRQLWLAVKDGDVAAGALVFSHNRHMVYWHGASHRRYLSLHPASHLQYVLLRDAWERKLLWYDFNPSAGLEGVVFFKSSFGAEKLAAQIWRHRRRLSVGQRVIRRAFSIIQK